MLAASALAAIALLSGCKSNSVSSSPAPGSPLSQQELPTTDGATAIGNLNGQIASFEKAENGADYAAQLVALLSMRGQYLGRLCDYDRADELAERLVRDRPKSGRAYLVRAGTRSTFHRFAEAEADLDRAARLGERPDALAAPRATLLQATGRYDEALALRRAVSARGPDIVGLAAEAALLGEMGDVDGAERRFIEAQHHHPDVAAFPVAWLYFQEGLLWERAGNLPRARRLYEASLARLDGYAPATAHLAGVEAATGARDRAVALLAPLVEKSDDPEYPGQLAALLREAGRAAEADALRDRARARYDDLLARHRAAFADHAARFFLGDGADPARALALAVENANARRTRDAQTLLLEAALAAGSTAVGCEAADAAISGCGARCDAHLRVLASRAYSACGRPDRAAAELAAAGAK